MPEHRCVFDSRRGFTLVGRRKHRSGRNLILMCACGRWGSSLCGKWRAVPSELLPKACRTQTWFHKLFWALGKNAFGIAFIAVMVLFLFLV